MTLKLLHVAKSPRRVLYVLEKKQEFINEFKKFINEIDSNLGHNMDFEEFGRESSNETHPGYNIDIDIKSYVDNIF